MKYLKILTIICSFLTVSFLCTSCEADINLQKISDEVVLHPNLIIPLGSANISLDQILISNYGVGNITTDGSEINYTRLDSTEFKFHEINLLAKAQSITTNFSLSSLGFSIIPSQTKLPLFETTEYLNLGVNQNLTNEKIDSVLIDSAILSIIVNQTDINIPIENVGLNLVLPDSQIKMLSNGTTNIISCHPLAYGLLVQVELKNFMFYTVDNSSGFPIKIEIISQTGAIPVLITNSSNFQVYLNFDKMSYKVAYGYFEPDDVATKILSTPLDLNKNLPSGLLKFTNPQIIISAISNIGTYLIFQIDYVKALVSNNPTIEPVYAWFAGHTTKSTTEVLESKPAKPGFSVTKVMRTFDKDWGETNQLFKSVYKPDILEYKFSTNVNKSLIKNDPTANFMTPDAAIKVYMKTIIPFQFDFGSYFDYNFSISNEFKTLASELDKYPNESIDSAALVLNIVNGFPVNTQLKIKFIGIGG